MRIYIFYWKSILYTAGADFLAVEKFEYLPKMIKPLTLEELKEFYRELAAKLGREATI